MITLYDLVFADDRRPSPYCWRTKLALKHKGLDWRDEPTGFIEKEKIAFARSTTVPVIHDGTKVVKDSWAIAEHLEANYAGKPLFPNDPTHSYARFVNGWTDLSINAAIFPLIAGDLVDRVRPEDRAYIIETRSKRIGTTDFAGFQAKAREKGVPAVPGGARAGPTRADGAEIPLGRGAGLSRLHSVRHADVAAESSARSNCWTRTTPSMPGASACSTCSTAWARKAKGP